MTALGNINAVYKREFKAYFQSPVAYVFLVAFLLLTGFLTFFVTYYYERRMADMQAFFFWHPWVYLLLVPAATMGLWAEERRSGTIELLLTMPVTMLQTIVGKFLAAWSFIAIALALTFPLVITTRYLGNPDMGPIICAYIGSVLMAGTYVGVGMLMSSTTRSQVVAFVLALTTCLVLVLAGWSAITGLFEKWAPAWLVDGVAAIGFMPAFEALQRGVLSLGDIAYYISVMIFMIFATHVVLDNRKTG